MNFLVDANILSEITKPDPNPKVVDWIKDHEENISVDPIILGEIQFGILMLPAGARRRQLDHWFEDVVRTIHCFPFEPATGLRWARLLFDLRKTGRAMPIKDSLIAATALVRHLILVTHNETDFVHAGVKILDPFDG